MTPAGAGNLTFTSSNSSVISVGADGKITTVGAGSAVVTVGFAGDYKYLASSTNVSVVVTTVATEINVDSTEITLYVDDQVNVNATLNYPEAGNLIYTSSNDGVVTVDTTGKLTATGEGEATINITFAGNGKYMPSSKTIKVVVSRIPTQITVDTDYIEMFVDDKVNVNATFSHPEVADLIYDISNGTIASVDEWGNIVAKHEGTAEIYISYLGSNKYLPSEKIVTIKVSRIATEIDAGNDTLVEIGESRWVSAVLTPNKYGKLHFNSSNPDIILIDDTGFYSAVGFGSATITVSFAGDDKYAPSSATVKLTVKGRQTEIRVINNVTLTVEDSLNLGAELIFSNTNISMGSADLKYTSSDPSIVSVDRDGKITALKSGKVQILVYYEGSVSGENIVNYPSNATVNVTSIPKASDMSVSTNRVTLEVRKNTTVTAKMIVPTEGTITFTSENESIATVTQDGFIKAVGKGTTRIIVNYAGNKDYLPCTKYITVRVTPLPVEIAVNDSFTVVKGNEMYLNAVLTPDVGSLTYTSSDSNVVDVLDNGKVWAKDTGISVITVRYGGNSEYDEAYKLVTVQVTLNTTSIDVADNVILSIGDVTNINATLNPAKAGNLIYTSSNESVVRIFSDGRMVAMKEGSAVITIKFDGSYQYEPSSAEVNVTVVKNSKSVEIDINPSDVSDDSTFSISLPPDATGDFSVIVDGKVVATKALKNGKATIKVTGLSTGDHSVTVVYSGDKKYAGASKSTTIHIYEIKIKSKNISKLYTSKKRFRIQLTRDTQALSGKWVKFTLNGKKIKVKTSKNGYASIKVNLPPRAKAFKVTVQFGKVKVKNTIKVKSIIKAKNWKVKKPKKVLRIKVSLKKVNGKFLKGKVLKLKFRGKTFKAKTNKKGKAVFKVKKKYFKKLKVGKKYKFKVTYKKNTVKRTLKFKR